MHSPSGVCSKLHYHAVAHFMTAVIIICTNYIIYITHGWPATYGQYKRANRGRDATTDGVQLRDECNHNAKSLLIQGV